LCSAVLLLLRFRSKTSSLGICAQIKSISPCNLFFEDWDCCTTGISPLSKRARSFVFVTPMSYSTNLKCVRFSKVTVSPSLTFSYFSSSVCVVVSSWLRLPDRSIENYFRFV
jgi:hypothetical protein